MDFIELLPVFMFLALALLLFSGYPVAFVLGGVGLFFGFIGIQLEVFSLIEFFNILSRIWGGIHPYIDDIPGRLIGQIIGNESFEFGAQYFQENLSNPEIQFPNIKLTQNPISKNGIIKLVNTKGYESFELFTLTGELQSSNKELARATRYFNEQDIKPKSVSMENKPFFTTDDFE